MPDVNPAIQPAPVIRTTKLSSGTAASTDREKHMDGKRGVRRLCESRLVECVRRIGDDVSEVAEGGRRAPGSRTTDDLRYA